MNSVADLKKFQVNRKKYQFKPSLIPTLMTFILLPLFLSLGGWQLNRATEKQQMLDHLQRQLAKPPVTIQNLPKQPQQWQYLSVAMQGKYRNQQQFLLDNKIFHHQVGYEVITPLQVPGLYKLILVNRGWIPAATKRQQLPMLKSIFGEQEIHGIIRVPLGKAMVLDKEQILEKNWPKRIQTIDFKQIATALNHSVYPFIVLLDPKAPHGFARDWQFVNIQPAKHIGYAIQWFAFAALLLILYFILNIRVR